MTKELLQQALDALQNHGGNYKLYGQGSRNHQAAIEALEAAIAQPSDQAAKGKFTLGDMVKKKSGSEWTGVVVGTYSTCLTLEGYAVESSAHAGSVQIYPASALELAAIAQPVEPADDKLLQIIAATYQIAGVYDAPEHVLDVLANPAMATQKQIDSLLPFAQPVQPAEVEPTTQPQKFVHHAYSMPDLPEVKKLSIPAYAYTAADLYAFADAAIELNLAAPPVQPTATEILIAVARGWCHPLNVQKVMDKDLVIASSAEVSELINKANIVQPVQPAEDIHSCSFFCDLPGCIKTQRDLLRDQLCKKATL